MMEGERYCGHEVGKDWFGVEWTYEPKTGAPMPTPGKELFEDIARKGADGSIELRTEDVPIDQYDYKP